jgi:hypothetical protein
MAQRGRPAPVVQSDALDRGRAWRTPGAGTERQPAGSVRIGRAHGVALRRRSVRSEHDWRVPDGGPSEVPRAKGVVMARARSSRGRQGNHARGARRMGGLSAHCAWLPARARAVGQGRR